MTFQIDGLNLYITDVASKGEALAIAFLCKWMIGPNNLIQVERLPKGIPIFSIKDLPERFDPSATFAIKGLK